jgi:PPOX class probable F420-dependent enzyme
MLSNNARAFLNKPLIARLSTIGADGYPHTVPIWYMMDGEDVLFISDRTARKTQNALANPKGAVTIGGDLTDDAGYLLRGDIRVEDDTDQRVTHRMIDRYEDKENGDRLKDAWKNDDIVVLRLTPKSVVQVR